MNIEEAALRHMENRPRTIEEMKKHLKEKKFAGDEINDVISRFVEMGYLNDIEYVVAYVNYGFTKGKSLKYIRYELMDRGVSSENIEEGIYRLEEEFGYDMEEEEKDRALKEAKKAVGDRDISETVKAKAARRLSSKGYDSSTIYYVLGELERERREE